MDGKSPDIESPQVPTKGPEPAAPVMPKPPEAPPLPPTETPPPPTFAEAAPPVVAQAKVEAPPAPTVAPSVEEANKAKMEQAVVTGKLGDLEVTEVRIVNGETQIRVMDPKSPDNKQWINAKGEGQPDELPVSQEETDKVFKEALHSRKIGDLDIIDSKVEGEKIWHQVADPKDPDTRAWISNRGERVRGGVALLETIPAGMNEDQFRIWIEERIRTGEGAIGEHEGDFIGPEALGFIQDFKNKIGSYAVGGLAGSNLVEFRREMARKVEARGIARMIDHSLESFDYKTAGGILQEKKSFTEEHIDFLRDETFGVAVFDGAGNPSTIVLELVHLLEQNNAAYWQEAPYAIYSPRTQDNMAADPTALPVRRAIMAYLDGVFGVGADAEGNKATAERVARTLFRITGMEGFYSGRIVNPTFTDPSIVDLIDPATGLPVIDPATGNPRQTRVNPTPIDGTYVEYQIMDEIDPLAHIDPVTGRIMADYVPIAYEMRAGLDLTNPRVIIDNPELRFVKNERYWDKVWERREAEEQRRRAYAVEADRRRQAGLPPLPPFEKHEYFPLNPSLGSGRPYDDYSNVRRLMSFPEELYRINRGRAESLRFAAETYLRPVPIMNGERTLEAYLRLRTEVGAKDVELWRFGAELQGASEAANAMLSGDTGGVINEPFGQGKEFGPKNLGEGLQSMIKTFEAFKSYTSLGMTADDMRNYSVSRLLKHGMQYMNSDLPDRVREFGNNPRLKPDLMYSIISSTFMERFLDARRRSWTRNEVGAPQAFAYSLRVRNLFKDFGAKFFEWFFQNITKPPQT